MKRLARRPVFCVSMLAATSFCACADVAEDHAPGTDGPTFRFATLGTCTATGAGDRQFPSDSDRIVVELAAGTLTQPYRTQANKTELSSDGDIVFTKVPVGTGMTLRAAACNGSTTTWAGRTTDVDVVESEKSFPAVFLTPVGQVACAGQADSPAIRKQLSEPRAFAALAASGDAAFALGGGKKFTRAAPNFTLEGTATVDRYDATTGEIQAAGQLKSPRLGALARTLEDGKIRIIGGATSLRFAAAGKPGVFADGTASPASATEIYDPIAGTSSVEVSKVLAAMPSLGVFASGAILAVGGSRESGVSDEIVVLQGAASPREGTASRRFGAAVVALDAELALVWGGNVDGVAADVGVLVDIASDPPSAVALTTSGVTSTVYGASAALLASAGTTHRVLVVGGAPILAGGVFKSPHEATIALSVVTVDTSAKTASAAAVNLGSLGADGLKRAFGALLRLPGGDFVYLGGFTAFSTVQAICGGGADCLQGAVVRFGVDESTGSPVARALTPTLALNGGPLGANATELADGSWFVTGGIDSIATDALGKDPGLIRYADLAPDLCAEVAPATTP